MTVSLRPVGKGLLPHIATPEAFAKAFPVTDETLQRLKTYADCLALWQRRINLVAPGTMDDVWHRHFADSAQILDLAPRTGGTWVDIGSGAGFPGLVVAILLAEQPAPTSRVILVESDQRKCAFLAEVVRQTKLASLISVEILCARIELDSTRAKVAAADVLSARALAPLEKLLGLASPLLAPRGLGVFMKGRGVEAELSVAEQCFKFSYELVPSRTEAASGIVVMRGPAETAEG